MNDTDVLAIQRLLSDFAWHADGGDAPRLAQLFTTDGELHVAGQVLQGRAEIAADCAARVAAPGRKTRHTWSNLRVEPLTADRVEATAIQVTYEQREGAQTEVRINDLADVLHREADGQWRFRQRVVSRQMRFHLASEG